MSGLRRRRAKSQRVILSGNYHINTRTKLGGERLIKRINKMPHVSVMPPRIRVIKSKS